MNRPALLSFSSTASPPVRYEPTGLGHNANLVR